MSGIQDKTTDWVKRAAMKAEAGVPESIHIDQLLGQFSRESMPEIGQETLITASEVLGKIPEAGAKTCLLVFPLCCSEQIVTDFKCETEEQLTDEMDEVEPPSLYVMHRNQVAMPWNWEEYRKPLHLKWLSKHLAEARVYYRCYRDPRTYEQEWEFSRALYIEI